jgi:uncharacterized membrane protein
MEFSQELFLLIAALSVCIGVPYFSMYLESKNKLPSWLNPIIICYGVGLFSSIFLFQESNKAILEILMYISILLAISLHLLNSKISSIRSYGKDLVIAYLVCVVLAGLFSIIVCIGYQNKIEDFHILSGMIAGLYSGGNLNLSAVGKSLGGSNELISSALYTDILSGTFLILFLISLGPRFYGLFLKKGSNDEKPQSEITTKKLRFLERPKADIKGIGIGFAVLVVALVPFLIPNLSEANKTLCAFILISVLSLIVGQTKVVKPQYNTAVSGDFFLLVFCCSLSLNVDLAQLLILSKALLPIFVILITAIMLSHIFICRLLGIDRKKAMVAFVAALYGVPFISQITNTLKAPSLLSGGIGLAVLGMAIGNIFGIFIALLSQFFAALI